MACWATGEPANITEQQDHRRKYRAAVSWTDFNAGRILDTIEEQGFANDTAVIFNGASRSAGALRSWLDGGTDSRVPQVITAGTWASRAAGASEPQSSLPPSWNA